MALQAARAWGVPPTEFLNDWSERDRELSIALFLHERSMCPGCGHPKAETWVDSSDAEYHYLAEEVKCLTCSVLESAKAGSKNEKGLHYIVERQPLERGRRAAPSADVDDVA